jgi:uncharacterized protein (DUF4415 family)
MTEEPKRYRGQRGPNKVKRESMKLVAIRLPQKVVDHFEGRTPLMRAALIEFMQNNSG